MLKGKVVACDTETTGLSPYTGAKVFLHSFANEEGQILVLPEDVNHTKLEKFYADDTITKVFHNAQFDIKMLEHMGYKVRGPVEDTLLMARLVDEYEPSHNLEKLCKKFFKWEDKEKQALEAWFRKEKIKKADRDYSKVPMEIMSPYAGADAWNCMKLYYWYKDRIKEMDTLYRHELRVMRYLIRIEDRGVLIDKGYTKNKVKELKKELKTIQKKIDTAAGMRVKVTKARDIMAALFKNGATCLEYTEKGEPKLDKDALPKYDIEFVEHIVTHRLVEKNINVLEKHILGGLDSAGVLHTHFNLSKARTGRFSSSGPNLQNINRRGGIRECFIPRKDYKLFYFDYSQIEVRLFAHYSRSPKLIKGFKTDPKFDTHQLTADIIGRPEQREMGKKVNFTLQYGGGAGKVASTLGIDIGEARTLLTRYHEGLPHLKKLMRKLQAKLLREGCIKDEFGKIYSVPYEQSYKCINALIQGCACNILKVAMVNCRKLLKGRKSHMVQNIHDELVFEIHNEEYDLIPKIKRVMENFHEFTVPLVVDIEYTDTNWGDKQPWEESQRLSQSTPAHTSVG